MEITRDMYYEYKKAVDSGIYSPAKVADLLPLSNQLGTDTKTVKEIIQNYDILAKKYGI